MAARDDPAVFAWMRDHVADAAGYAERIDPCIELGRAALDDGAI